jgi:hypothetical protein
MACEFLKFHPNPYYIIAWKGLFDAQRRDGSIIGTHDQKFSELSSEKKKLLYFNYSYHTTYVTAMLSFLHDETITLEICQEPISNLMSGRLIDAIRRADLWIEGVHNSNSSHPLNFQFYLLLEKWIAYNTMPNVTIKDVRHIAIPISERVTKTLDQNSDALKDVDIGLTFIGLGILRNLKIDNVGLEKFLQVSNLALNNHSPASSKELIDLLPMAYLFDSLGYQSNLTIDATELVTNNLLFSDGNNVKGICNIVSFLTGYGRLRTNLSSNFRSVIQSNLQIHCLNALCNYDLENALELLRTLNYLRMRPEKSLVQMLDFLLDQQRSDGRLGYYGNQPSVAQYDHTKFSIVLKLYLPITVSAIWTFAEIAYKNFSVLNSIRLQN